MGNPGIVTLRSVLILMHIVGGAFADGDAVPDGHLLGADEHVLDEESQTLTLGNLVAARCRRMAGACVV